MMLAVYGTLRPAGELHGLLDDAPHVGRYITPGSIYFHWQTYDYPVFIPWDHQQVVDGATVTVDVFVPSPRVFMDLTYMELRAGYSLEYRPLYDPNTGQCAGHAAMFTWRDQPVGRRITSGDWYDTLPGVPVGEETT